MKVAEDAINMWKGNFSRHLTKEQSILCNNQFRLLTIGLGYCKNRERDQIPTNFEVRKNVGFKRMDPVGGIDTSCTHEVRLFENLSFKNKIFRETEQKI
jgi:hypothetical protein